MSCLKHIFLCNVPLLLPSFLFAFFFNSSSTSSLTSYYILTSSSLIQYSNSTHRQICIFAWQINTRKDLLNLFNCNTITIVKSGNIAHSLLTFTFLNSKFSHLLLLLILFAFCYAFSSPRLQNKVNYY